MSIGNSGHGGRPTRMGKVSLRRVEGGSSDGNQTEKDLLMRAAHGDEQAVRELYRTHSGVIFRVVVRIVGPADGDVEDVVQTVFLAALDSAERFEGRSKLSTWLVGIATKRAIDRTRARWRQSRWKRVTQTVGMGRPSSQPNERHGAIEFARLALETLRPEQRAVFVLHQVEGYTLKEISQMTGVGISTLHARLKSARVRLDSFVAEHGRDEEQHEL